VTNPRCASRDLQYLEICSWLTTVDGVETPEPENRSLATAFAEYQGHIYRFLLRRTGNHHDAEELTQRVFADAAEALSGRSVPPRSLLAWLYTVAERRFIDEVRRRETARRGISRLEPSPPQDQIYGREVATALREAIRELPEGQRIVVVRKVLQGHSFADIAQELGITVDACKMRLSRAVAQIRIELERQGLRGHD
jgi:RNA polymerase sigma-70 factor, ECF subfamily